jgi:hypothetical protein
MTIFNGAMAFFKGIYLPSVPCSTVYVLLLDSPIQRNSRIFPTVHFNIRILGRGEGEGGLQPHIPSTFLGILIEIPETVVKNISAE